VSGTCSTENHRVSGGLACNSACISAVQRSGAAHGVPAADKQGFEGCGSRFVSTCGARLLVQAGRVAETCVTLP
jgi:hypothetical protein